MLYPKRSWTYHLTLVVVSFLNDGRPWKANAKEAGFAHNSVSNYINGKLSGVRMCGNM